MPFPTPNTSIVAEGLANLIGQYKGLPNIQALLTAGLAEVQAAEDMLWGVLNAYILANNPTGQALQNIAVLIGCPAGNFTDAQLLTLVRAWILARRSKGRSEDILAVCRSLVPGFLSTFVYEEFYPEGFQVWSLDVADAAGIEAVALALNLARPPEVLAVLGWSNWPTNQTFFFGDSHSGLAGSGLEDSVSGTNPQALLSAIIL